MTPSEAFRIEPAQPADAALIVALVRELGAYERLLDDVRITPHDLFVRPAFRGRGYGAALLRHLARLAVERGCARFEWSVLDWNEPALAFYRKLGAVPMDDRTVQRVSGDALRALAAGDEPGGVRK
jgi:GNAT superfamily N-acetyltransferase